MTSTLGAKWRALVLIDRSFGCEVLMINCIVLTVFVVTHCSEPGGVVHGSFLLVLVI